jgi:AcrR family transcriptional regulator
MSMVAVAADAGTTRQAVYRRWPHKADLAAAAIASLQQCQLPSSGDPFADLVRELDYFRRSLCRPDGLSMVGTMLQDTTDPELRRRYREQLVVPRRKRLRTILQEAIEQGLLDADADLDAAIPLLTGAWYARSLADDRPVPCWAERTAALVWRALGGDPPIEVKLRR